MPAASAARFQLGSGLATSNFTKPFSLHTLTAEQINPHDLVRRSRAEVLLGASSPIIVGESELCRKAISQVRNPTRTLSILLHPFHVRRYVTLTRQETESILEILVNHIRLVGLLAPVKAIIALLSKIYTSRLRYYSINHLQSGIHVSV